MSRQGKKKKPKNRNLSKPPDREPNQQNASELLTLSQQQFQGPLPPPEILQEYDTVVEGAAERIIVMAEAQASHRKALEAKALDAQVSDAQSVRKEARLGQIFAFLIAVMGILTGAYVVVKSSGLSGRIAGTVLGGTPSCRHSDRVYLR